EGVDQRLVAGVDFQAEQDRLRPSVVRHQHAGEQRDLAGPVHLPQQHQPMLADGIGDQFGSRANPRRVGTHGDGAQAREQERKGLPSHGPLLAMESRLEGYSRVASRGQNSRPFTWTRSKASRSTPSRQRTFTAAISLPSGILPNAKAWVPQSS